MRQLISLRRFPQEKSTHYLMVYIFKKKLFRLFFKSPHFLKGPAVAHKLMLKFTTLREARQLLRILSLFQRGRWLLKGPTKKNQILRAKQPGAFFVDVTEERAFQKDESTLPVKKRGKKYAFNSYKFLNHPINVRGRWGRARYTSKNISLGMVCLSQKNFISSKFFCFLAFNRPRLKLILRTFIQSSAPRNFFLFSVTVNCIFLLLWLRRLFYIQLILHANNSSNSESR